MKVTCFLLFALATLTSWAAGTLKPAHLRCEYLNDPLGIDTAQPRLSWIGEPSGAYPRGARQTAYQILVASTPERLADGQSDVWDSGRVASDNSIHVRYEGPRLASGQFCHWKVRLWDSRGEVSAWSEPARWSMGLLEPADWLGAQWIGRDEAEKVSVISGTQWIWFPEGKPEENAPAASRYFRRRFDLPHGPKPKQQPKIVSARLYVAADNEFTAYVNGVQVGTGNNFKVAAEFDVAARLAITNNVIAIAVKNAGETNNPAGLLALLEVEMNPGGRFVLATDDHWRVSRQGPHNWERPSYNSVGWELARVLGPAGMAPWGEVAGREDRRLPARYLRTVFRLDKKVRRATAYFSGLGLSELYVNGTKVGDAVLSPGLTDYSRRVFYVTHDVTELLKRGTNCVGTALGNGRYFAPRFESPTATRTYGFPKMLLRMRVEFEDGSVADLVSDDSWKLTTDGPIQANNEYDGEEYDARKEMKGWTRAEFDDSGWGRSSRVMPPGGVMAAQMIPPIRVVETLPPRSFTQVGPGVWIYDFGQNLVGWCRLKVRGKAGEVVSLRHAETLAPDGSLYLANLRGAKVTDTYILRGKGDEDYEPSFTYHGFRYVELRGFPGKPDLDTLTACVVHDDLERAGEWTSSSPVLNQIYRNIFWGVRGNYRSLPTDCPQRDERQGWLGDRSEESKGEAFLYNTAPLYAKWVQDFADAQLENGSVSDVCPPYWPLYSDNVTWPSSTVLIPGHLHTQFGDAELIRRHYPSMKRWMDHMATFIKDDLMPRDTYGDWCVPPEDASLIHSKDPLRKTDPTILGTTYYFHCCEQMAFYAELLGKPDDARHWRELAARLKTAFNAKFYDPAKGYYDNGSQTSCVLPLALGLVPEGQGARVFGRLVSKITDETKNHVGTGLIGGQWLMRTLTANARTDLAFTLASNTTYPSWGYMVQKGATTIWELWNGDTADPAMNSGNHVMLVGDLILWFHETLAGIQADPARPAFKHIIMRPTPVGDLTHVRATHRSPYGLIVSEWRVEGARGAGGGFAASPVFKWEVTIPANTTATLHLPGTSPAAARESGKPLAQAIGLLVVGKENGRTVVEAEPGRYSFECR